MRRARIDLLTYTLREPNRKPASHQRPWPLWTHWTTRPANEIGTTGTVSGRHFDWFNRKAGE